MGTAAARVRRSETDWAIWTPRSPNGDRERSHTRGMKKMPCRAMATKVAGTVRPMVWSIMLLMVIHAWKKKVTHWNRRATVPMAMTPGSSRNRAMSCGAKANPSAPITSRKTAATFTQNQKPSFTR